MRNYKSLAAAITTALSVTPGIATALVGNQLDNVNGTTEANNVLGGPLTTYFGPNSFKPDDRFDFSGGQMIIQVEEKGVPLAAELFSTGNLVIPTPLTGTGPYMALIYTIDGEIIADFDMTFTLDGGATFAENPFLGVRDTATNATCKIGAVTSMTAGTDIYAWSAADTDGCLSNLGLDEVFRFDTSPTLYQVALENSATINSSITFYQLGRPAVAPIAISGTPTQVYGISSTVTADPAAAAITAMGTVSAVSLGAVAVVPSTAGGTTLMVNNYTGFTVGWSYQCVKPYGPDGLGTNTKLETVFTVASNTSTATVAAASYPLIIKAVASSIAGIGGFNSATAAGDGFGPATTSNCDPAAATIYRVHLKGETAISVTDASKFTANKVYQFGGVSVAYSGGVDASAFVGSANTANASVLISVQTAQYQVTAIETKTNTITVKKVCAQNDTSCTSATGLDKTLWADEFLYDTVIDMGDDWSTTNATTAKVPMVASGATGKNVATFTLKAGNTSPSLKLRNNDQIMLLYRLGTANKLAEAGQSINMSVVLKTPSLGISVNPARTATVARSVQAVNAQLKSIEGGTLHIAVSTGSTQFSGENPGGLVGYQDNYIAQIGQLILEYGNDNAKMEDGVTAFKFKGGTGGGEVLAAQSKLTITGGQLEASTALPGKAVLHLVDDGGDYDADPTQYTRDAEGWTAVWNLDTTRLQKIADATGTLGKGAIVRIRTDGKTPVNTVENNPVAVLNINYDTATYGDVTKQSTFRKITKDGTVCTVYNVPPPKKGVIGADSLSIRVTNDSAIAGKLTGKLYDQAGGDPIWSGDLTTEEVAIGATARFTSEDLETITGVTWDGRAVLEISTILPKIEVLAMIRQNGIRMAPLSNLSVGAHGTSCAGD